MSISDAASHVEEQAIQINIAIAVLREAMQYFDSEKERQYLPFYAEQISNLLFATNDLLRNTLPALNAAADAMYEKSREEKQNDGKVH